MQCRILRPDMDAVRIVCFNCPPLVIQNEQRVARSCEFSNCVRVSGNDAALRTILYDVHAGRQNRSRELNRIGLALIDDRVNTV